MYKNTLKRKTKEKQQQNTSEQIKTVALFIPNIVLLSIFPLVSLRRRQYKLDRAEKVKSFKI